MWPTFSNLLRLFLSLVQRILQYTEPLTDAIIAFTTQVFKVLYSHCTGERTPQVRKKSGPIPASKFQERNVDVTSLETTHPMCQVYKHYQCIGYLSDSYLLKGGYTWNGLGSKGQSTHGSMWTLGHHSCLFIVRSWILVSRFWKRGFQLQKLKMFFSSIL